MRKLTFALLAGMAAAAVAGPALAQNPNGDRDRDGVPNAVDRRNDNGPRGDRDHDGRPNAVDRNDNRPQAQNRDNDHDGIPNRYDRNDRRPNGAPGYTNRDRDRDGVPNRYDRNNGNLRPNGDRDRDGVANRYDRNDYSRGFGYRSGWTYNNRWTPYGWGYGDPATRAWVQRFYGRTDDRAWRRAQVDFYRFADVNRDGIIERWEYDRAMRDIYRFRRY